MSLIAQAKGARDPARMSLVTRQAISSGVLVALVLTLFGLLMARPLMRFANSGGDPAAVELGTSYLRILFIGTPFLTLNIICNRLMQGAGDTVTPLMLTVAINVLNIGLNALFMFGLGPVPAYGVDGAAIGTVISRGIGVVAVLAIFYSGRNVVKILAGTYRPHWPCSETFWRLGYRRAFKASSAMDLVCSCSASSHQPKSAPMVRPPWPSACRSNRWPSCPCWASTLRPPVWWGRPWAPGRVKRARQSGNVAIALGVAAMVLLITPILLFAPAIIRLFDPSAHPIVMAAGSSYMRINTIMLPWPPSPWSPMARCGAGDSLPAMFSTLLTRRPRLGGAGLALCLSTWLGFYRCLGGAGHRHGTRWSVAGATLAR